MGRTFVRASSQYLEAATSPIASGVMTLAAWYRPSSLANGTVFGLGATVGEPYMALGMNASGNVFLEANTPGNTADSITAAAHTVNTWGHMAGVVASTTSRTAYLNGTAATPNTTLCDPTTLGTLTIGALNPVALGRIAFAGGDIGEVALWNVALTGGQIAALAAGALPSTIPTGLVGYWKITGSASPELDSSGGGRSMTVSGAVASGSNPPVSSGLTYTRTGTAIVGP